MIGNIAHQWRQPLSVISSSATGMQMQKEWGLSTKESEDVFLNSINESAQHLSKTIDDFRYFFKPDKKKVKFDLGEAYQKTLRLVSAKLQSKEIEIIENINTVELYGLDSELIQVIINLLNNASDALENKQNQRKLIFVHILLENNNAVLKVKDNAGGVPPEIISKVFEPYFTTKHQSQGTGIGLFMCQEIIQKHMHGSIDVENIEYTYEDELYTGAQFTLVLPLEDNILA
ncbi:MAG: HAMP domain-containing sensor histidine kinase, partial [Campylobacterota bacterium]|nr:HAMP domain-containing sensor histidine kinase [Campylobacterota bacterium]